jgi:amino acid transporter
MKFKYRYIIYKIYSWTANKRGDTPIANTILTLGIIHLFQLAIIMLFIDRVITPLNWFYNINVTYILIGTLAYFVLLYFLLYNKERWSSYVEEFGNESERERKIGTVMVIAFLVGSILLFFISLPILFSIGKVN